METPISKEQIETSQEFVMEWCRKTGMVYEESDELDLARFLARRDQTLIAKAREEYEDQIADLKARLATHEGPLP